MPLTFEITDKELEIMYNWFDHHGCPNAGPDTSTISIEGGVVYEFFETSIGLFKNVKCARCNQTETLNLDEL